VFEGRAALELQFERLAAGVGEDQLRPLLALSGPNEDHRVFGHLDPVQRLSAQLHRRWGIPGDLDFRL
jgi:hypothetical protein